MRKILYITNLEVPYRARFFELLSQGVDLTVLFECQKTINRNQQWMENQQVTYKKAYLGGFHTKGEHRFSLSILSWIRKGWDLIIIGGYNSPVQSFAILMMRLLHIPFAINIDGESFIGTGLKSEVKKFFLRGAKFYLAAGEKSAQELEAAIRPKTKVFRYNFSSLDAAELAHNAQMRQITPRADYVLVVGANFAYKGMDVALHAAQLDSSIHYRLVGMGKRTELFLAEHPDLPTNVEVIPFLQKDELYQAYAECALCVLPSRQECWGLVVNEAASFGAPIVSTLGSGAAKEFLMDRYPQYLAQAGDAQSLLDCIRRCLRSDDLDAYSQFLIEFSGNYCLEKNREVHIKAIEENS